MRVQGLSPREPSCGSKFKFINKNPVVITADQHLIGLSEFRNTSLVLQLHFEYLGHAEYFFYNICTDFTETVNNGFLSTVCCENILSWLFRFYFYLHTHVKNFKNSFYLFIVHDTVKTMSLSCNIQWIMFISPILFSWCFNKNLKPLVRRPRQLSHFFYMSS